MQGFINYFRSFVAEEDGAQAIEYALLVAVVSLSILIAMRTGIGSTFGTWLSKVSTCLSSGSTCTN